MTPWSIYSKWTGATKRDHDERSIATIIEIVDHCLAGRFRRAADGMIENHWHGDRGQVTNRQLAREIYDHLREIGGVRQHSPRKS